MGGEEKDFTLCSSAAKTFSQNIFESGSPVAKVFATPHLGTVTAGCAFVQFVYLFKLFIAFI